MAKYGFGLDLGGTTCKCGLFSESGELIEKWEVPTDTSNGGVNILKDLAQTVVKKMDEKNLTADDVVGVGIGIPGPVSEDGVVNRCVNLGWGVFNVEKEFSENLGGIKVRAGNDANVAALGEMWQGGGKGHKNVVMVTLGTGVGGGIIVDSKIVAGSFGAGGEIGHIKVSKTETAVCGCGKTGCLEQYASATGIVRRAQKLLSEDARPSALRNVQYLSSKEIFDAARQGDALAIEVVETAGDLLGMALSYISCVVDPEVYVIGGGVSKAGQILLDTITKHFTENAFHASRQAAFTLAQLGNDAGMYGAVKLVV